MDTGKKKKKKKKFLFASSLLFREVDKEANGQRVVTGSSGNTEEEALTQSGRRAVYREGTLGEGAVKDSCHRKHFIYKTEARIFKLVQAGTRSSTK